MAKGSFDKAASRAEDRLFAGCVEVGVGPKALAARLLVIMVDVLLGSGRADVVEVEVGWSDSLDRPLRPWMVGIQPLSLLSSLEESGPEVLGAPLPRSSSSLVLERTGVVRSAAEAVAFVRPGEEVERFSGGAASVWEGREECRWVRR